jgi:PncC family amidohydrolase
MNTEMLLRDFADNKLALGAVESVSGGLLASTLTAIPGISRVFKGGIVSYSIETKVRVVGVDEKIIAKYGVVSPEVAEAMAICGRKLLNVDVCVSTTGVAGPHSIDNVPVGLVYVGISFGTRVRILTLHLENDRVTNQNSLVSFIIDELIKISAEISKNRALF